MKKYFKYIIIIFVICYKQNVGNLYAQKHPHTENLPKYDCRPYHFGFTLCVNKMDFAIHPVEKLNSFDSLLTIKTIPQWGFNIGIVSDLTLIKEFLNLRFVPTLSFGERALNYTLVENGQTLITSHKKVESTYIDFPLFLKYKSKRLVNKRAYVLCGGKYSLDLASQAKKKDRDNEYVKLQQNDFLYEVGVGFDFYLEYFKFATELKMSYGMRDLLKRDNSIYTDPIKKLNSKIFQLSFLFE